MYSKHNEGESVVGGRFIRTLRTKFYKYTTSVSKNIYIDKLDDIVNKYNNKYQKTIKVKPVDVKLNTYIDPGQEINEKYPKNKQVIMLEHQNIRMFLQKETLQVELNKFFVIKKVKNTVPWTYVINNINVE